MLSLEVWHAPNYHILVSALEDTCLFFCNTSSAEAAKTSNSFQKVRDYCSVISVKNTQWTEGKYSTFLPFFSPHCKKMFYVTPATVKVNQAD